MVKSHPQKLVLIVMRVHLFPSRTQKLSSFAPTILGGRLPGKIGNANTSPDHPAGASFLSIFWSDGNSFHLFPVAVPSVRLGDGAPALHTDRGHSLPSLPPPPAAVGSLPRFSLATDCDWTDEVASLHCPTRPIRKPIRVGWVFLLELLARFELATSSLPILLDLL